MCQKRNLSGALPAFGGYQLIGLTSHWTVCRIFCHSVWVASICCFPFRFVRERSVIQLSPFPHVILGRVAAKNLRFSGETLSEKGILRFLQSLRLASGARKPSGNTNLYIQVITERFLVQ